MKNKLIVVLVVIVLVLVLLIGGAVGFLWYRDSHIFVEGTAYPKSAQTLDLREEDISFGHYESLRAQLPDCRILWNVPFQGGKYSSDSQSLTVSSLTEQDVGLLMEYFPDLKTVDAMQCRDYLMLELLKAQLPDCQVKYEVSLGGKSFDPDVRELVLENGDYDYVTMMANLIHLPDVEAIQLKVPELTTGQIGELRAAYEDIQFSCTVELLGREYDNRVTELDLRDLTSEQVEEAARKLSMLPDVTYVELTKEDGTSGLAKEDVLTLKAALPEASFNYTFDFYGVSISTMDEEVHIKSKKIGDEGIDEVRSALSLMENCSRFVLEYCQISYDLLAQVRDEFRGKTKLVWRVEFGGGSTFTDAEIIRSTYGLRDSNCKNLIYCEDARFLDFGHNGEEKECYWRDCSFVAGMPNLEAAIFSGSYVADISAFANCKNLKFLELAFCGNVTDISALKECTKLEMLNISFTSVTDISPLYDLDLTHLCAKNYSKNRVSQEDQAYYAQLNPDCWALYEGEQPYGPGWRYTEDGKDYLGYYAMLRDVFRYNLDPNIPNHVGWYLPDGFEETYADLYVREQAAEPAEVTEETVETEAAEETVPAEETTSV